MLFDIDKCAQTTSLSTNFCLMYNLEREVNKELQVSFVYIFGFSNRGRIFKPRHNDGTLCEFLNFQVCLTFFWCTCT